MQASRKAFSPMVSSVASLPWVSAWRGGQHAMVGAQSAGREVIVVGGADAVAVARVFAAGCKA